MDVKEDVQKGITTYYAKGDFQVRGEIEEGMGYSPPAIVPLILQKKSLKELAAWVFDSFHKEISMGHQWTDAYSAVDFEFDFEVPEDLKNENGYRGRCTFGKEKSKDRVRETGVLSIKDLRKSRIDEYKELSEDEKKEFYGYISDIMRMR